MSKWNYDLREDGQKLRKMIVEGDSSKTNCENILKQLIVCCEHIEAQLTLSDREEYEYDIDTLATDCEDLKWYLEEDDEEYNEDCVNEVLNDFYDLMDTMRVWVAF
mgnify:CR=1 FL=1